MKKSFDYKMILNNWESLIRGSFVKSENLRAVIYDSWLRCKQATLNPLADLPEPDYNKAIEIYQTDWIYGQGLTLPHLTSFYKLLKETDSAIFYITDDLMIVSQRGSETLLNSLNAKNIGIGTYLTEEMAGTNAAYFASLTNTDAYVVGPEHYVKAFHDFACSATSYKRLASLKKNYVGYIMFVTNVENFHYSQLGLIRQYGELLTSSISFYMQQVTSNLLDNYIENSLKQPKENGLILVDQRGMILHINTFFEKKAILDSADVVGHNFSTIFPALKAATDCLVNNQPIQLKEVNLERNGVYTTLFMDCEPICENEEGIGMIITLQEKKRIHKTITMLSNYTAHYTLDNLIGHSSDMQKAKDSIKLAAQSPSNVLITGETGTGKELFAQSIHTASNHINAPFVSINCASIPRELIGSELFGYVEGAFTGARKGGAIGKFELADKGTIFLDEIGEMPIDMQSALLRVLEERKITRIGGNQQIPIDVKIIAATNKDLQQSVANNEFRMDLYYRLNVINIDIPPLRMRKEDIPELVSHFIGDLNNLLNKNITNISDEAMESLQKHHWPGNVRELRNTIERAINQCQSDTITYNDLPNTLSSIYFINDAARTINTKSVLEEHENWEREKILSLMIKFNGNKSQVAKALGISRSTLYKKLGKN